jgi:hypothetical protein
VKDWEGISSGDGRNPRVSKGARYGTDTIDPTPHGSPLMTRGRIYINNLAAVSSTLADARVSAVVAARAALRN